jgi:hypothetical protein
MPEPNVASVAGGSPRADIITEDYLRSAEKAFAMNDVEAVEALFLPNGYLRE